MAGFAQHFRQEGRQEGLQVGKQEGLQVGLQEGRVEGERKVLERQLHRRFGDLSPEITVRLSKASSEDLENWAENVLDAKTLDDVFDSSH